MHRRIIALAFVAIVPAIPLEAQVTIQQLQRFLESSQSARHSDEAIAERLCTITLGEQLTVPALSELGMRFHPGPKTAEQLQVLAAASIFKSPPESEGPAKPAPDLQTQHKLIASATEFAEHTLRSLPDFLATRATVSYANLPIPSRDKRAKPEILMHFIAVHHREITYRNGREVDDPNTISVAKNAPASPGLSTWGEFGPILTIILTDTVKGSVTWSRWQMSDKGPDLAVFHYRVPQDASHYQIDYCCHQKSIEEPELLPFRTRPAYHGDLYLDPTDGSIARITLEAELSDEDPMTAAGISADYGPVEIGGRSWKCPVAGVAFAQTHNREIEKIDPDKREYTVNLVRFSNFQKFGSSSRILTSEAASADR